MKVRLRQSISSVGTWIVLVSLWVADGLIWVMLRTRSNERRIQPTERISWPKGLKQQLMRRQDNTCVYCGHRRIARSLDIDHIVPAVRGGSNDISNLQVICSPCNQRKGDQTDEEFRTRYASLVPRGRLTPPRRRISQAEFRAETRSTSQVDSVQQFRQTRFISKRDKSQRWLYGIRCSSHHRHRVGACVVECRWTAPRAAGGSPGRVCRVRCLAQSVHDRRDDRGR